MKLSYFLLTSPILLLLSTNPLHAASQFESTFVANYTVSPTTQTQVSQEITLTNKQSDVYATEYAIEIGSASITDINPTTNNGQPIPFSITQTDNSTVVNLKFDSPVVGKDKQSRFTLTYQNPDIAIAKGNVVELNIPKTDSPDIDNYTTKINIDKSLGLPSIVTPNTYDFSQTDTTNILTFDQSHGSQSITALFGDSQTMTFTFNYHLDNPTVNKGVTQIALAPDTPYQKVSYTTINPKPESVHADPDGNWIATYTLKPKQTINVVAQGHVELFLKPTVELPTGNQDLNTYLKPRPFWPVDDPHIQQLAQELKTPKAIYDYLVENFSYDYTKLESPSQRLGAAAALDHPDQVMCQEFTDTFIALARAAGIPAREHNGFAYTQNSRLRPLSLVQDVLHSWPEYYDTATSRWIPIDPTWGNTTGGIDYFNILDLNHFTFVVKGTDSQNPYPAGYYKLTETSGKDVHIDIGTDIPTPTQDLQFDLRPSPLNLLGFTAAAHLSVTNLGSQAIYDLPVSLTSPHFNQVTPSTQINQLLPFSTTSIKISLDPTNILDLYQSPYSIHTNNQTYDQQIQNFYHNQATIIASSVALGASLTGLTLISWRLLVFVKNRIGSIRR